MVLRLKMKGGTPHGSKVIISKRDFSRMMAGGKGKFFPRHKTGSFKAYQGIVREYLRDSKR